MNDSELIPSISNQLHSAFHRYMTSAIVELVAKNDMIFFVHKGILDHHSIPFQEATRSGPFEEIDRPRILLRDWDEQTLGRLVQFMYTGNYRYPGPGPEDDSLPPVVGGATVPAGPDLLRSPKVTPSADDQTDDSSEQDNSITCDADWLEQVNVDLFDFEEVFLAHVSVYALAHRQSIAVLKTLSFDRLSQTLWYLHPFGPNPHLAGNIVTLATYVYANLTDVEEPLRLLVSKVVGRNFSRWHADPAAVEMMCRGGDFVRDVLPSVCTLLDGVGVSELPVASVGTRYIARLAVVSATDAPPNSIRELDGTTGKATTDIQTEWLVAKYTVHPGGASTHVTLVQSGGVLLSALTGKMCGTSCRIIASRSPRNPTLMVELVLVRCRKHYLNMALFPGFTGMLAHTAHDEGYDSLYFLWKSMRTTPA